MTKIFVLSCVLFLAASGFVHGSHEKKKKKDDIKLFELKKGDFSIKVTNWGATLVSVILPDKNGTQFKPFHQFFLIFIHFNTLIMFSSSMKECWVILFLDMILPRHTL